MAAGVRVVMNDAGMQAILDGPAVSSALDRLAKSAMKYARGLAAKHIKSSDYFDSFEIRNGTAEIGGRARQTRELWNTSDHAAALEWGHAARRGKTHGPVRFVPGYRILGRTLDYLGGG